jgi:hypothetical protein
MATKIKIKKSQLQGLINEQMKLLREQQENHEVAKFISKLAGKFKTTPNELYNTTKEIMNSTSSQDLKKKILNKNPDADPTKIEKISKEFIEAKKKFKEPSKTVKHIWSFFELLFVILGIVFAVATGSGFAFALLGAAPIIGAYIELKKKGLSLKDSEEDMEAALKQAEKEDRGKWYHWLKWYNSHE